MVVLTISPKRGNHARYFPHSGYLGLTPVVVTGVVETRLEEDNQPIEASKLIVRIRCYEAVGTSLTRGRPEQQQDHFKSSSSNPIINDKKSQHSNVNILWQTEKTLWTAASQNNPNEEEQDNETNDQYDLLGDWKSSWKLVIPINAVLNNDHLKTTSNHHQNHLNIDSINSGCAIGSINYKSWKSWWQVETVIYHKPAGVLGSKIVKSHGLYLVNYGEAQKHYNRSIEESTTSIQSTTRMTNKNLRYSITAPSSVCCGDEVEIIIRIGSSSFNHQQQPQYHHQQQQQQQHRSSETICRPTTPGKFNELIHKLDRSDISLKRLQVSLVRRLAVQLVKSSSSTNNNHDGQPTSRIGNPSINPFFSLPLTPQINPISNHTLIGTNNNHNNSKFQLTTFHTLITNTAGISKSNVSLNLENDQSSAPSTTSLSKLNQDAYDLAFIVKLKIPTAKSKSHYSIGETFKTNSTTVSFFFQFQLSIKNKLTNRLEVIELNELNVQVFSISKDQIKFALDQLNKLNCHPNNSSSSTLVNQNRLLLNPSSSSPNVKDNSLAGSSGAVVDTSNSKDKFSLLR